jgi:hypothetical protein
LYRTTLKEAHAAEMDAVKRASSDAAAAAAKTH